MFSLVALAQDERKQREHFHSSHAWPPRVAAQDMTPNIGPDSPAPLSQGASPGLVLFFLGSLQLSFTRPKENRESYAVWENCKEKQVHVAAGR